MDNSTMKLPRQVQTTKRININTTENPSIMVGIVSFQDYRLTFFSV
jgi:hypothetical protein